MPTKRADPLRGPRQHHHRPLNRGAGLFAIVILQGIAAHIDNLLKAHTWVRPDAGKKGPCLGGRGQVLGR